MIAECAQRRPEPSEFLFFLRTLLLQAGEPLRLNGKHIVNRLLVRRKLLKSNVRRHRYRPDGPSVLRSKVQAIGFKPTGTDNACRQSTFRQRAYGRSAPTPTRR